MTWWPCGNDVSEGGNDVMVAGMTWVSAGHVPVVNALFC